MELEDLSASHRMLHDLDRKIPLVIGLCQIESGQFTDFVQRFPEFIPLLLPLIEWDPKDAAGEIQLQLDSSKVKATVRSFAKSESIQLQFPKSTIQKFIQETRRFAFFMTDGGNTRLNL